MPSNSFLSQENNKIIKPIFIVGAPRSGTTVLYDYISCHSDLAWFSLHDFKETLAPEFWEFQSIRRRLFGMRQWRYNGQPNIEAGMRASFEVPDEYGYWWNAWTHNKIWATEKDVTEDVRNNLLSNVSALLSRKGKKRFLSKSPPHSVRMRLLNSVFPDAIFINIIRDGRAVVASMISSAKGVYNGYFGIPLRKDNQMDYNLLERHARQWIEVNEEIQNSRKYLRHDQYFELRYEDFIQAPDKHLAQIFRFCELRYEDIFDAQTPRLYRGQMYFPSKTMSSQNRWQEQFTMLEISKLNDLTGSMLRQFEYL